MTALDVVEELLSGLRAEVSHRDRALRTRDYVAARRAFLSANRMLAQAFCGAVGPVKFSIVTLARSPDPLDCPHHLVEPWVAPLTGSEAQTRYVRDLKTRKPLAIVSHPRKVARDFHSRLSCGLEARALPVWSWWSRASVPVVIARAGDAQVWGVIDALAALVRQQEAVT